ncbi:MAG: sigma-70 family RNA polymerase sigma factor [Fimbriimonadaceae bacterium]|nr:sigma-70 family RNA polymerase sigma factor [Chitinophagales bacterium]
MEEKSRIHAAQKDPQEFRYFYDIYFKDVFLFIYRRTDDESLSADITQQVFLKALQNIGRYEYRGVPFSSWLYRIAGNEIMQHFRDAKKVRVVCIDSTGLQEILSDDDETFDIEKREQAFAAIRKLPPPDLELIEMRYFEKRSFAEIGEIKNITANNAKVKVHRILDRIKKSFTVEV